MTIYIDTNTFSAVPSLYADEDKKKALPRVIPSVLLNEGIVRFGFLGDYAPTGSETVCVVASIPEPGNPLRVLTSYGTQLSSGLWEVPINFDATEIADALVNRGSVNLSMGVIVEGADSRREFQFWIQCFSSSQGEISPEETADAKTFADASRLSADNAAESESQAAQSATSAANSASAAAESATNASNSATNAEQSASNAASSASAAKTSETNAKTSETNAAQSKEDAQTAASSAADSADNAAESESAAGTSATNASNSASNAAQSASNAASSAGAAKTSETNAKASETAAKSSQTAAANSASSASTSATNAADSASAAKTSATNAGNSATSAAQSAEQAAQSAEQAAETLENVYTKPEIDGVDTGAEVTLKMNEIIEQLKEYEATTGDTLPLEFWEALMAELQRWQENPTEVKEWETYKNGGKFTSTCPYYEAPSEKPIVDFSVIRSDGYTGGGIEPPFSRLQDVVVYLPYSKYTRGICALGSQSLPLILPSTEDFYYGVYRCKNFDHAVLLPKCKSAIYAFSGTNISPTNIATTLDSLKDLASEGSTGKIAFSRYDGTLLAPLMAESPYVESVNAAVAKGWTVQFD